MKVYFHGKLNKITDEVPTQFYTHEPSYPHHPKAVEDRQIPLQKKKIFYKKTSNTFLRYNKRNTI